MEESAFFFFPWGLGRVEEWQNRSYYGQVQGKRWMTGRWAGAGAARSLIFSAPCCLCKPRGTLAPAPGLELVSKCLEPILELLMEPRHRFMF